MAPQIAGLAGATIDFARQEANFLIGRVARPISRRNFAARSGNFGIPSGSFAPARNSFGIKRKHFDALGRKIKETYPPAYGNSSPNERFWYDEAGNLKQYQNPAGQTKYLNYDNRNRVWDTWWDGGVGPLISTRYDAASRVTSLTTNNGETVIAFNYDAANRLLWEDQTVAGLTHRVQHDRDADGNAINTQVTGGYLILLHYNQRNQMDQIQDGGGTPWINFTYDAAGNLTKRQDVYMGLNDSLNVPSQYYDGLNRPTMWENTGSGDIALARSWQQYDTVGRMSATWRDEQGSKGEWFRYNVMNQLTAARYEADNVWTENPSNWLDRRDYTYTADHLNREGVNLNGPVEGYQVNTMNQYYGVGGLGVGYDGNFNLRDFDFLLHADYNAQSQMISATKSGNSVSFIYDGLGRCVKRTINNVATIIAYDGWKPLVDYDGSGNLLAANIYGPGADEILTRWVSALNTHLRYHHDVHGNVTWVLNDAGEAVERYTYDAFGKPKIMDWYGNERTQSAIGNRFLFQGREWIAELGIYDYRHRMYMPGIGRFLQSDPTGFDAGDMNLFRYCGDDPVDRSDPTGLVATDAASSIWNRLRIFDSSSSSRDSLYSLNKAQDRTWAIRNLTAALVDQTPSAGQQGAPAAIRRYTVDGPHVEKSGNGFVVHIPWTLQLLDKEGNPTFGKGIFIDENVDRIKRVNFDPARHTEKGHVTKERGVADDGWHLGFKGPTGQVTIVQTMIVDGRQAKFPDTTIKYNGREVEVEPPGAWAPFK